MYNTPQKQIFKNGITLCPAKKLPSLPTIVIKPLLIACGFAVIGATIGASLTAASLAFPPLGILSFGFTGLTALGIASGVAAAFGFSASIISQSIAKFMSFIANSITKKEYINNDKLNTGLQIVISSGIGFAVAGLTAAVASIGLGITGNPLLLVAAIAGLGAGLIAGASIEANTSKTFLKNEFDFEDNSSAFRARQI